ncbi:MULTISPECIES: response regulator [Spirulina sp. CCY15215]|uniref:response regulator n=1 Tax=Spirulina sp. CCY15215 TaxID=2767591 RepID=UPI00194DE92A|nr:response regulator [Spirulina major]
MNPKRLLVIDDDDGVRATIALSLEATTDWEILTAASGKEGLILAESQHPDAILLDVMMPDLSGIEVLQKFQSNTTTQNIPVIFITAKIMEREKQEMKHLGIKGIISKPFNAVGLWQEIHLLLNW